MEESVPMARAIRHKPYQPSLFTTTEIGRVVPIEMYQRPGEPESPRRRSTVRRESGAAAGEGNLQGFGRLQQTFRFGNEAPEASGKPSRPVSEAQRNNKAPVAVPMHRIIAGTLDASIVVIAVGMMAMVIHLMAGMEFFNSFGLSSLTIMAAILGLGYKLMWIAAGTESPGLRWSQLRLVNFDGQKPTQRERLERFAWSGVSVLAGGLGLLWALVDEENLTWHDHSSKTFLTCFSTPAGG
jgi:uncharacterized RDD family membrane protein YckC